MSEIIGVTYLLLFVIKIAIVFWVYTDAEENSPHSAVLWALVALFGGLLGLLLYLIIGRDTGRGNGELNT